MICELFIFVVLLEFFPRYFSESFLDSIPEERKKMSVRSMFPVICVLKTLKLYSFINKVTISHNSNYKNLIYVSSFIPIEEILLQGDIFISWLLVSQIFLMTRTELFFNKLFYARVTKFYSYIYICTYNSS